MRENDQYVEFNKQRDLGAIIGDTINFLKNEGQPFFSTILKFSIIPILITVALSIYYIFYVDEVIRLGSDEDPFVVFGLLFSSPFLILSLAQIVTFAFIMVSAYAYIKSYAENRGKVNFDDVREVMKDKLLPYIGLSILNSIVIVIGFLFLFVPAVYFGVVLTLSGPLLIFEEKSVSKAFGDSFSFIKNYWWETFGVLLVIHILIWVLNFMIDKLIGIYNFDATEFIDDSGNSLLELVFSDPIYLSLLIISSIIAIFFNIVTVVSNALIYFDIYEKENPDRYNQSIDSLGTH
jgi:hypothetical protein